MMESRLCYLPKLEIRSELYGAFSLGKSGMVDVTDKVAPQVKDGRLRVQASNDLGGRSRPRRRQGNACGV